MSFLRNLLYAAHLLAALLIVAAPVVRRGLPSAMQTWAARAQLLLGLALVAILMSTQTELNHVKLAVKLLLALAVVGACEVGVARHRQGRTSPLPWIAAGLALLNVAVATMW